jgi:hypothetical protein
VWNTFTLRAKGNPMQNVEAFLKVPVPNAAAAIQA